MGEVAYAFAHGGSILHHVDNGTGADLALKSSEPSNKDLLWLA